MLRSPCRVPGSVTDRGHTSRRLSALTADLVGRRRHGVYRLIRADRAVRLVAWVLGSGRFGNWARPFTPPSAASRSWALLIQPGTRLRLEGWTQGVAVFRRAGRVDALRLGRRRPGNARRAAVAGDPSAGRCPGAALAEQASRSAWPAERSNRAECLFADENERGQLLGVMPTAQLGDGIAVRLSADAEDPGEFFEVAFVPGR
jgi:hypothetical protein